MDLSQLAARTAKEAMPLSSVLTIAGVLGAVIGLLIAIPLNRAWYDFIWIIGVTVIVFLGCGWGIHALATKFIERTADDWSGIVIKEDVVPEYATAPPRGRGSSCPYAPA